MSVLSRLNLVRPHEDWRYKPPDGSAASVEYAPKNLRARGFYSQCGPDKFVTVRLFRGLRDSVLEDIGAYDGSTCNSTIFLDAKLDWMVFATKPFPEGYRVPRPTARSLK